MPQFRRIAFADMSWRARLGLFVSVAAAVAVAIAFAVLSIGLALILLPIVALGLLFARWRLGRLARGQWPDTSRTIEIELRRNDDGDRR